METGEQNGVEEHEDSEPAPAEKLMMTTCLTWGHSFIENGIQILEDMRSN